MKNYKHYLNGKYVTENKLLISPRDLGFTRSFAVFTKIKTHNGRPFKLEEHLSRLLKSAELINLDHTYTVDKLRHIVSQTLNKNNDGKEKTLKVMLSGGVSDFMYQSKEPTLLIIVDLSKPRSPEIYKKGVKVNLIKFTRYIPGAKTTNYIEGIRSVKVGIKKGFFEPVYYSNKQVHEGSNSNIFVVKNKKIYTPKNNIYYGILRNVLVSDLKESLKVIEKDFNLDFLLKADEVFITGSGKEIVPVIKVDYKIIGDGKVGKVTKRAILEFKDFLNSLKW